MVHAQGAERLSAHPAQQWMWHSLSAEGEADMQCTLRRLGQEVKEQEGLGSYGQLKKRRARKLEDIDRINGTEIYISMK